jgi:hypothetical protein
MGFLSLFKHDKNQNYNFLMNCLNRFTRCFSSYKSSSPKKSETKPLPSHSGSFESTKVEEVKTDKHFNINEIKKYLFNHEETKGKLTQLETELKKEYWFSKYFSSFKSTLNEKIEEKLDELQFELVKQQSIDDFLGKPLDNPNSSACWANTALETLKFCFPFINAENQGQVPELMKFSKGENVNSNALRRELKQILINSEQFNRINDDGTVNESIYDDPNITLQTSCSKLGLNNNTEKFFNCKLLVREKPPKELLELPNRCVQTAQEDNTPFQVPACNKFVMAIMRGDLSYTRCTNLFTPFQIEDSPESPSYQPLAITCNVSAHFVSFQKIGAQWYLKDDLNVLQRRLNEDATIVQKPDLKKAIQLDQPCHLDNKHPEKTWEQYIEEKVVNVLFEKTPTVASTVAPTEEV